MWSGRSEETLEEMLGRPLGSGVQGTTSTKPLADVCLGHRTSDSQKLPLQSWAVTRGGCCGQRTRKRLLAVSQKCRAAGAPRTPYKGRAGPLHPPQLPSPRPAATCWHTLFSPARPRGIRLYSPVRVGRRHPSAPLPAGGGHRPAPSSPSTPMPTVRIWDLVTVAD